MPRGRPRQFELSLSDAERAELTAWVRSRSLPHALVQRAQVMLRSAGGERNAEIGAAVRLSPAMVGHWRRRFQRDRLAGLYDAPRSGRPRTHDEEDIARLLRTVLRTKPKDATQ